MYEAFYGLREKPFNLTPDPRFLFLSEKHKEAFAHLLYGIKNRGGFVMVTGEIGTGKTTICRTLLNNLEDDTEVAFIFNPCLSPEELLRTINQDFGIATRALTIKGLIDELNAYLLDRRARNKNCVLVIDEAQDLTPAVLEQIRLLSNLETETEKLLQIVLIGQPELAHLLELTELRQLNQRITARYHLRELSFDETLQYIAYRLRVAGGRRKVRFTRSAIRAVYRHSRGVPRVINAICDRALLVGYTVESRDVTGAIIRRAAREVRGERLKRPGARRFRLRALLKPAAVAAAVAVGLAGAYWAAPIARLLDYGAVVSRQGDEKTAVAPLPAMPVANPAPAEAPAGPAKDYDALFDALDPVASRDAAAEAILRAWDVPAPSRMPRGENATDLVQFAVDNGLDAQVLLPTLDQLISVDLPAFVLVLGKGSVPMWVGIVGRRGDDLQVAFGSGQTEFVPRSVLDRRYTVQAVVLWRDPAPGTPVLGESNRGDAVLALQQQLRALDRLAGEPTGVYDSATAAAIRRLQGEMNLEVDGKVGRQTRMVLCSWSADVPMARLSASDAVLAAVDVQPVAPPAPTAVAEAPAGSLPVAAAAVAPAQAPVPEPARTEQEPVPPLTPYGTGLGYLAGFTQDSTDDAQPSSEPTTNRDAAQAVKAGDKAE